MKVSSKIVDADRMSDVESRMYASPADIKDYLSNNPKKPYLNCEYMHSKGNSVGGFANMSNYMMNLIPIWVALLGLH